MKAMKSLMSLFAFMSCLPVYLAEATYIWNVPVHMDYNGGHGCFDDGCGCTQIGSISINEMNLLLNLESKTYLSMDFLRKLPSYQYEY